MRLTCLGSDASGTSGPSPGEGEAPRLNDGLNPQSMSRAFFLRITLKEDTRLGCETALQCNPRTRTLGVPPRAWRLTSLTATALILTKVTGAERTGFAKSTTVRRINA